MKEKEFKRWHKYRKIGKLKFTLLWALYLAIVINVADCIVNVIKGNFIFDIDSFFQDW